MMLFKNPLVSGLLALTVALVGAGPASATFSIVAVDPNTGEVGSAGASCINAVVRIGDPIEGIGAINTQAFHRLDNQMNARARLLAGDTPEEVIAWLVANDVGNNPAARQYGVVDLDFGGRSAAHTGSQNADWKGHLLGPNYAIQGNILGGPFVLDRMEAAFLAAEGEPLADRLMKALEATALPGSDSRCRGSSSLSAYIKVLRIGDEARGEPTLSLTSTNRDFGEPIVALRHAYDMWRADHVTARTDAYASSVKVTPPVRPADGRAFGHVIVTPRTVNGEKRGSGLTITATLARTSTASGDAAVGPFTEIRNGVYIAPLTSATTPGLDVFTITVDDGNGSEPVTLAANATCRYVMSAQ